MSQPGSKRKDAMGRPDERDRTASLTRREVMLAGVAAIVASGASLLSPSSAFAVTAPVNLGVSNDAGSAATTLTSSSTNVTLGVYGTGAGGNPLSVESSNVANFQSAALVTTLGTGNAVEGVIDNASSSANAVQGTTNGDGSAVQGTIQAGGAGTAVSAYMAGDGTTLNAWVDNASNAQPVVSATTNGTGPALYAETDNGQAASPTIQATAHGLGAVLDAEIVNVANSADAVSVSTVGTGSAVNGWIGNDMSGAAAVIGVTEGMGTGVQGQSNGDGYGVTAQGGRAPIWLVPGSSNGAPVGPNHVFGEVFVDATGALYKVVVEGTPADEGVTEKPAVWVPMLSTVPLDTPVRLIDTRTGTGGFKGALSSGKVYNFKNLRGAHGIPATAVGLVGNLTMVAASGTLDGAAWMAILPATKANGSLAPKGYPPTSTVNAPSGCLAIANQFTVAFAKGPYGGQISLVTNAKILLHAVVDVTAYIA